jgi:hypothetical protein
MDGALESVLNVVDSKVLPNGFVIVSALQAAPDPDRCRCLPTTNTLYDFNLSAALFVPGR